MCVIGREWERQLLADAVDSARSGPAVVLVVVGSPGIGKSVLLSDATAYAREIAGPRVVEVRGVQAERDVPYAGLHALLGPLVPDVLDTLPAAYRDALEVALGLREGAVPPRLAIGAATLGVLASAAPLVVVVDDLQWLDPASVDALTFAARRLVAEPVAFLAAIRAVDDEAKLPAVDGLPLLTLQPLEDTSGLVPHVVPSVASWLHEATGGSPLAVLEIARALTPGQAAGATALPANLPVTDAEQAFAARLDELPYDARARVRLAAVAGACPRAVLEAALVTAGGSWASLGQLEHLGLATVDPDLVWRHPLARSAAARGRTEEIRESHRRLAEAWAATREGAEAPARAWHLAGAADGHDDETAALLVRVALGAEAGGASADAADAWERAARLTKAATERAALVGRAARAALAAGSTLRAAGLLDEALLLQTSSEEAARLLWLRGRVQHGLGEPDKGMAFFLQAVDLSRDPDVRVWAACEGMLAAMYAGRPDQVTRMADLARAHDDPGNRVHQSLVAHAEGGVLGEQRRRRLPGPRWCRPGSRGRRLPARPGAAAAALGREPRAVRPAGPTPTPELYGSPSTGCGAPVT